MKSASQSKLFTYEKPLRVPIVEAYSEELQPLNPEKIDHFFRPIRSKDLTVTPKNEKCPKMKIELKKRIQQKRNTM